MYYYYYEHYVLFVKYENKLESLDFCNKIIKARNSEAELQKLVYFSRTIKCMIIYRIRKLYSQHRHDREVNRAFALHT